MDNFLKKIQKLPQSSRLGILIGLTSLIMFLAGYFWVSNITFSLPQASGENSKVATNEQNLPSIFETLKSAAFEFKQSYSDFKENLTNALYDKAKNIGGTINSLTSKEKNIAKPSFSEPKSDYPALPKIPDIKK